MTEHVAKDFGRAIRPSMSMPMGPVPKRTVGPRFRSTEEQAEVVRRVAIYIEQVERNGRIRWLPFKGKGKSA
jgi:hypothetical protein